MSQAVRRIAGLVLAGGAGSRIGGNKPLQPFRGRPLIEHVFERFEPQLSVMAIGTSQVSWAFEDFGLAVMPDLVPGRIGPLSSVAAGLNWAERSGCSHLMTVPCDTPFLPLDLVARLAAAEPAEVVVAESGGQPHYTVALWQVGLAADLAADVRAGRAASIGRWLEGRRVSTVTFDETPDPFFNINTLADLAAAAAR